MTELKPCPFCGGEVSLKDMGYFLMISRANRSSCKCGVFLESRAFTRDNIGAMERAKERLIEKWNTRANPWHTGTPTRTDCLYLVLWFNTEDKVYQYSVLHWHDHLHYWFDEETPSCLWGDEWKAKVVAWMPFEPYKEAGE